MQTNKIRLQDYNIH